MKYKHTLTGWTAKNEGNTELTIRRLDNSYVGTYPLILFEGSSDWKEVKERLLTTMDGHNIYECDDVTLYFVDKIYLNKHSLFITNFSKEDAEISKRYLCFISSTNRDICFNKGQESLKSHCTYSIEEIKSCYPSKLETPLFETFISNLYKLNK